MRDYSDDTDKPAPATPQSPDGERTLTAQDVMELINQTRQKGFALRDLVQHDTDHSFKPADFFKRSSDDIPPIDPETEQDTTSEIQDLANLVADRQTEVSDDPQADADRAPLSDLAAAFDAADSDQPPADAPQSDPASNDAESHDAGSYDAGSYDAGHEAGFSAGFAQGHQAGEEKGRAEAQAQSRDAIAAELEAEKFAQLTENIARLDALVTQLTNVLDRDVSDFTESLTQTVYNLVNERVGREIDAHPQDFIDKIERLAERITSTVSDCSIRVAPADLQVIQDLAPQHEFVTAAKFSADDTLSRGDVLIRAGNIRMTDVLKDAL